MATPGEQLMARLGLDTAGFKSALRDANGAFKTFAGGLLPALSVAGLAGYTKQIVEFGARIFDLGKRYQVSTDAIQKFGHAAEENGSSIEGVAKGFNKLEIAMSRALGGNSQLIQTFANLGITVDDLRKMTPEEIMVKLGKSSMNAGDMVKLLGKSALELIPTLRALANGTAEYGEVIDKQLIAELKEADKELTKLGQRSKVEGAKMLSGFKDAGTVWKDIGANIAYATTKVYEFNRALFTGDWKGLKDAGNAMTLDQMPGFANRKNASLRRSFADFDFDNMPGSPGWLAKNNISKDFTPPATSRAELAAQRKDRERDQLSLKDLADKGPHSAFNDGDYYVQSNGTAQMIFAAQQARLVEDLEAQAKRVRLSGVSPTGETSADLLSRADAIRQTLPIKETEKDVGIYREAFKTALSTVEEKLDLIHDDLE